MPGQRLVVQHQGQLRPAHLILRAVENRMPVARAANGGYSLFLDPLGDTVGHVVSPRGGLSRARLPVYEGRTLFSRMGDWVGPGAVGISLLLIFLGRLRKLPGRPEASA